MDRGADSLSAGFLNVGGSRALKRFALPLRMISNGFERIAPDTPPP